MVGSASRFVELLEVLDRHEVELIVVGGVAAVLEGAPLTTFDLDILFNPTPDNTARLLDALQQVHARYKDPAGRHIEPDVERLESMRMHLLMTDLGPLDVLRETADFGYPDLVGRTHKHKVEDLEVLALNLEALIEIKEKVDRPKDRLALMYLRRLVDLGPGS